MPDDHDDPRDDDPRDDELARALVVEPLDDLTRRRLVQGALAATQDADAEPATSAPAGAKRARVLSMAAAVLAFVVLGVAALTLPHDGTTDLAGRAPRSSNEGLAAVPEPEAATSAPRVEADGSAATAADSNGPSEKAATPLPDLGRLADIGVVGSRERVLAAAAPLVDGVEPQRWAFTFQTCPPRTLVAVATGLGTIDDAPVFVIVSRRDDGALRVRAIDGTTCRLRSLP